MWSDNETDKDFLGYKVHADLLKEVVLDPYLMRIIPRLSVRYVLVSRRFTHTILGSSICFQMGAWVKHAC